MEHIEKIREAKKVLEANGFKSWANASKAAGINVLRYIPDKNIRKQYLEEQSAFEKLCLKKHTEGKFAPLKKEEIRNPENIIRNHRTRKARKNRLRRRTARK